MNYWKAKALQQHECKQFPILNVIQYRVSQLRLHFKIQYFSCYKFIDKKGFFFLSRENAKIFPWTRCERNCVDWKVKKVEIPPEPSKIGCGKMKTKLKCVMLCTVPLLTWCFYANDFLTYFMLKFSTFWT